MTRKDYFLIACAVHRGIAMAKAEGHDPRAFRDLIIELAQDLGEENPRFNRELFIKVANGEPL